MKQCWPGVHAAILTLLVVFAAAGCSSFHREWKGAGAVPPPTNDMSGRWEGRWLSDVNGHTGKLRCLMTQKDQATYHAYFWGTFWKLFRFTYKVDFRVQQMGTNFTFSGESKLGALAGGTYHYDGQATPTNFFSTYKSKSDHGTFKMQRPADPSPP